MKILTISNCPLVESQGSGYVILNFCRGLIQCGHNVDLFGPDSYEILQFFRPRSNRYRLALGMVFFTLRQLRKKNYDIVEFYGGESWLIVIILQRLPCRKFLIVSHSNGLEPHVYEVMREYATCLGGSKKWYQLNLSALVRNAFTQVDGLVVVSKYDGEYAIENNYLNRSRLKIIENPLIDRYLGLNVKFQRGQNIGYCGTWLRRKGTKVIKEDIPRLLTDHPGLNFKLIGVGDDFKKEDHFPESIYSRIEIIPFVKDKRELINIFQKISIFIAPSIYESFGLVIAEAMACGCAVVATKTGFAANLINRKEAILLEKSVSPHLYNALNEVLFDESLRLRIAQAGYRRVQRLRWDLAVESLEKTYLNWLDDFRQKKAGPI